MVSTWHIRVVRSHDKRLQSWRTQQGDLRNPVFLTQLVAVLMMVRLFVHLSKSAFQHQIPESNRIARNNRASRIVEQRSCLHKHLTAQRNGNTRDD